MGVGEGKKRKGKKKKTSGGNRDAGYSVLKGGGRLPDYRGIQGGEI